MRFQWLTRDERFTRKNRMRRARMNALMEWHPVFLWWPTRIGSEVLWLERVVRWHRGSSEAKYPEWEYSHITSLLTKEHRRV